MTVETLFFSGTITSGTEENLLLTDFLTQGSTVMRLIISVENSTIVEVSGVQGLSMYNKTSAGEQDVGILLGGDLVISMIDYLPFFDKQDFQDFMRVLGTPKITFNQSTGADVDFAVQLDVLVD